MTLPELAIRRPITTLPPCRDLDAFTPADRPDRGTVTFAGEDITGWLDAFARDKHTAAFDFWCEIQKGVHEAFRPQND